MVCTPLTNGTTTVGWACGPGRTYRRIYADCPDCASRRRFVIRFDGYYYGETRMCCACGYTEMDGFPQSGTAESAAWAKEWWDEALSPRAYEAHVRKVELSYQEGWDD